MKDALLRGSFFKVPIRILTLVNLFLSAAALVQCGMILVNEIRLAEVSVPVVVIFLLVTPFAFAGSIFMAIAGHRMASEEGGVSALVFGYALFTLVSVDTLVYIPIHYAVEEATTFYILGGIELLCTVILFFYFQGMGPRILALVASVLLILSFGLEFVEAIRYFMSFDVLDVYVIYNLVKKTVMALFGVESILFVLGTDGTLVERKG